MALWQMTFLRTYNPAEETLHTLYRFTASEIFAQLLSDSALTN